MKVLKTAPNNWPAVAQSIFRMAMVYRRRAKSWRENLRGPWIGPLSIALTRAEIRRDREEVALMLSIALTRAEIRRDREEVALMLSWVREALGVPKYPHGCTKPKFERPPWRDNQQEAA